ncbi:MAG: site-specific DNA-methyltransferase [Firmicutes bacterium CAG:552_39_19]|nr:MAG: site-specific DNA-methyltransferase [Firmicutes bacterium CAG:552_39_19]
MALLQDLIKQIDDETLRQRIMMEVGKLTKQKKFGLVFEEHLPECTPLYDVEIRIDSKVALKTGQVSDIYIVRTIDGDKVICEHKIDHAQVEFALDELVAIAEFGEPIYPYLKPIDMVCNAPDSDLWHTLIEADNYHALQLLEYLYAGKVDCIYIDPPYNTGARDWKYNNDYVDGTDAYRHSKWLSFMEKRLRMAKKLLNPKDSVLIVTIDEKEYLHLGCLLEEIFTEARIQMITTVISAKGVVRTGQFSRVEEYIYILELGNSSVQPGIYNMLDDEIKKEPDRSIEWLGFRRRAPQAKRNSRPNQFYPVFVSNSDGRIISIGDVVKHGVDRNSIPVPEGCTALWPLSRDGDERLWSLVPEQARINFEKGYLRVNNWNSEKRTGTVYYLPSGTIDDIENGKAEIVGYNADGSVEAKYHSEGTTPPKRVWNMKTHNAETYGTNILNAIIGKRFDYPKSLYAVHDSLRFYVERKKDALIIDFFSGSGTTLHAVNLINAEDGGHRRCIMVTNNEVSEAEAKVLMKQGIKPSDEEWEKLGIARYVTWPRTVCSIEGHDVNGNPLKGNYLGSNIPMADGFKTNAAYFKLGFLDKASIRIGRQFREMLPILWMKAGCFGPCPVLVDQKVPEYMVLPENRMAILNDNSCFKRFAEEVGNALEIETVYLVTDSDADYRSMSKGLNVKQTYQLYRDYLDNFRINSRR